MQPWNRSYDVRHTAQRLQKTFWAVGSFLAINRELGLEFPDPKDPPKDPVIKI